MVKTRGASWTLALLVGLVALSALRKPDNPVLEEIDPMPLMETVSGGGRSVVVTNDQAEGESLDAFIQRHNTAVAALKASLGG